MGKLAITLFALGLGLGCVSSTQQEAVQPPADLARSLESLSLGFYDPESFQHYSAEGPFRVIRSDGDGVEFEGYDPNHALPARVMVFAAQGRLWARLRVDDREFLTRLR